MTCRHITTSQIPESSHCRVLEKGDHSDCKDIVIAGGFQESAVFDFMLGYQLPAFLQLFVCVLIAAVVDQADGAVLLYLQGKKRICVGAAEFFCFPGVKICRFHIALSQAEYIHQKVVSCGVALFQGLDQIFSGA